ncbi:MerR family transcriptional regulator [Shinella sp. AETb1-6]|jgi:DNA-binding transcriptional MerR regulator/mannose-6-phosphate isomerase-like protein (cupin superfamily)|uniref:MerR family transcriptional regulator n=1 Tax=Shinella sumterensis TaxID=1967501 RepID=A0AA50DB98_9HYPH|nr:MULTISPECIES: MerR family transcriptional regulator [Shinella]MDP9587745.1 DNA-binding transcriptional MerR regulator/mannose-6-phosphate isomerase-like protein (cupin superfamily) [Shinella zoogloeoides]MCD1262172.1 MerR family transcriptional regulator [Shinella sumterensis]MXN51717.1 MerR family transcriptional regulator [Shinella sp. AETb1-6]TFE96516.1 MerR family transcriptional regulator [Shinella sumterensis]UPA26473.1 MerR family transcriptional regulator [Shinella oryzae]
MGSPEPVHYKVTEAARLAGVSASTLRLWETQGLVVPGRSDTGHRQYSADDVNRLKRIAWYRTERGLNPAAIREALEAEEPAAETQASDGDAPQGIGRKFRSLRHAEGKTLEQVAGDIGIATSVLSTFERTSQGVTFRVLHDLADYYGTTVSKLSGEEETDNRAVVRSGEWKLWPETSPGVTVQVLADGRNMMDCHRFVLAPGATSDGAYQHDGEEFVHVLAGRVEIVLDGHEFHDLGPGDSLYFESTRHHSWHNSHDGETVLIWINTPPTF